MDLNLLINILDIFFWIIYMLNVPRMLHIAQLESYQNDGIFRWVTKNAKQAFKKGAMQFLITGIVYLLSGLLIFILKDKIFENSNSFLTMYLVRIPIVILAFVITNGINIVKDKKERKNAKKPLKYTSRAKRLMFSNFCILAMLQVLFMGVIEGTFPNDIKALNEVQRPYAETYTDDEKYMEDVKNYVDSKLAYNEYNNRNYLVIQPILFSFLIFTIPVNMIIANWFASPTETWINNRYINKAKKKLSKKEYKDLIRIGITGSYGKTSTKFILKTILEERYNVLATPGSYNTTMGNVRIIREQLKPEHQVFISEMGARKKRDIQEICDFVKPHLGIITSIGAQHLETFKNIETVAKTKAELLNGVTEDGAVFLPKDNSHCLELYKKDKHKKFLFSTKNDGSDVYAKNIKVTKEGSTFTVVTKKTQFECKTKLLGEHNVQNIIGCVAIADFLGLTKEEIQKGIEKIEPVEHRLQLIPSVNGTIVIDDAFNSNPVGSKMALDVIKQFEGRKIIITPGMVELGEEEYKLNKEFGAQMAGVVDFAILVGIKRSKPIVEGLKSKKFNDMNIYVVNNLEEATKQLGKLTQAGDVILFENDLPDNYNE